MAYGDRRRGDGFRLGSRANIADEALVMTGGCSGYRSVRAAAQELGLSEPTLRRFIRKGTIPAVQIQGSWRIPPSYFADLEREAYARCGSTYWIPSDQEPRRTQRRPAVEWSAPMSTQRVRIVRTAGRGQAERHA